MLFDVSGTLWASAAGAGGSRDPASPPPAARHWVNLRFFGPDGQERDHYRYNTVVARGADEIHIPLGLNDAAGVWKVVARDVCSGRTAQAQFTKQ